MNVFFVIINSIIKKAEIYNDFSKTSGKNKAIKVGIRKLTYFLFIYSYKKNDIEKS